LKPVVIIVIVIAILCSIVIVVAIQEQNKQERFSKLNECTRILDDFIVPNPFRMSTSEKNHNDEMFEQYDKCILEYSNKYETLDEQQIRISQQAENLRQQNTEYNSGLGESNDGIKIIPDSMVDAVIALEKYKDIVNKENKTEETIKTEPKEMIKTPYDNLSVTKYAIQYNKCLSESSEGSCKDILNNAVNNYCNEKISWLLGSPSDTYIIKCVSMTNRDIIQNSPITMESQKILECINNYAGREDISRICIRSWN
jgi:transcriptional regulator with PAS, ATPase and Fis domain